MEKLTEKGVNGQGPDDTITEKGVNGQGPDDTITDRAQVAKWAKHDLASSIALLGAIRQDQNLFDVLVDHLYGRIVNHQNAQKNQVPIEFQKEK